MNNQKKRKSSFASKYTIKKPRKPYKPYVPRIRGLETKTLTSFNLSLRFDNNSSTANRMYLINAIPIGGDANSRIGKKVTCSAVSIRGYVRAASATVQNKCALMLVWVKSPNLPLGLPAVADILDANTDSNSHTNLDLSTKFKIVRRWEFNVTGNSTTPSTGNELQCVDQYVQLKAGKYDSMWSATNTDGAITGFEKGALLLLTVGLGNYDSTLTPLFNGDVRVYFTDI